MRWHSGFVGVVVNWDIRFMNGPALIYLSLAFLVGIGLGSCEWRPTSSHFKSLDIDADQLISLDEWMAYYGHHNHDWDICWGNHFELADCNRDLQLSWNEYYDFRFRNVYCVADPRLAIMTKPLFDESMMRWVVADPIRICPMGLNSTSLDLALQDRISSGCFSLF